jgi:hypothetical protein
MELLESSGVRPRQARYQAALRPDMKCTTHSKVLPDFLLAPIHRFIVFGLDRALTVHLFCRNRSLDHDRAYSFRRYRGCFARQAVELESTPMMCWRMTIHRTGRGHRLVARCISGELVRVTHRSPDWLKRLFGRELRAHS